MGTCAHHILHLRSLDGRQALHTMMLEVGEQSQAFTPCDRICDQPRLVFRPVLLQNRRPPFRWGLLHDRDGMGDAPQICFCVKECAESSGPSFAMFHFVAPANGETGKRGMRLFETFIYFPIYLLEATALRSCLALSFASFPGKLDRLQIRGRFNWDGCGQPGLYNPISESVRVVQSDGRHGFTL